MRQPPVGAYGLAIDGLGGAEAWMQELPDASPRLRVEAARAASPHARTSSLSETEADLRLVGGGRLRMRRADARALFSFPEIPPDEDLLHPYLAPAAALAQLWAGREALHGGAFATAGGAVVVLAEKDGGKSTTLAWLAAEHRLPVLSDDLVVLTDAAVLPGPRCLDLRRSRSLDRFALGDVQVVRRSERLRLTLPSAPAEAPPIAVVVLLWGARTRLEAPAPPERLRELLPHRMYGHRLPGDPKTILQLAALPMLVVTRPRGRAGLRDAAVAVTDYLG